MKYKAGRSKISIHFQRGDLKEYSLPQAVVHETFRSIEKAIDEVEDNNKINSLWVIMLRHFCWLEGL